MKAASYILLVSLSSYVAGCAKEAPPTPVAAQPVTIVSRDFCALVDKKRDLTWSVNDTPESITNFRRLGAKWDARCQAATKPTR